MNPSKRFRELENEEIFGIRNACKVKQPTEEICKKEKKCPCWSDCVGCRAIGQRF